MHQIDTLIFDIGKVLCTWTADQLPANDPIDSKIFKRMVNSQIWCDYETGKLTEDQTYTALGQQFNVDGEDICKAVARAVETLSIRAEMFELIRSLKPGRKMYAMSNMSVPSWEIVKCLSPEDWNIFDDIFISGVMGHRKPELAFFHHVLRETGASPVNTVFVDDLFENLVGARSLGVNTIHFDTFFNVERRLHNKCGDPVERAQVFLVKNATNLRSHASVGGTIVYENFTQLLLLEATNNPSLVHLPSYQAEWNFFEGSGQFTDEDYPDDLDTTSIAWTVVPDMVADDVKNKVMDRMLEHLDDEGIPFCYFDRNRPRRDHGICANVVALFFANGRGEELSKAVDFLCSLLVSGAFLEGSRYYRAPETFLYFMMRLRENAPSLEPIIGPVLKEACRERVGLPCDTIALAMRLHCCTRLDINAKVEFERLLDMQQLDGSWEGGWLFTYGLCDVQLANKGLTTAISQRAVREYLVKYG